MWMIAQLMTLPNVPTADALGMEERAAELGPSERTVWAAELCPSVDHNGSRTLSISRPQCAAQLCPSIDHNAQPNSVHQ